MNDRDIDRQVAEFVMGWKNSKGRMWCFDNGEYAEYMIHGARFGHIWQPSTNIAHAFEVVGKMREKGWKFFIEEAIDKPVYNACFQYAGIMAYGHAELSKPAMAICKAALSCMEDKNER